MIRYCMTDLHSASVTTEELNTQHLERWCNCTTERTDPNRFLVGSPRYADKNSRVGLLPITTLQPSSDRSLRLSVPHYAQDLVMGHPSRQRNGKRIDLTTDSCRDAAAQPVKSVHGCRCCKLPIIRRWATPIDVKQIHFTPKTYRTMPCPPPTLPPLPTFALPR